MVDQRHGPVLNYLTVLRCGAERIRTQCKSRRKLKHKRHDSHVPHVLRGDPQIETRSNPDAVEIKSRLVCDDIGSHHIAKCRMKNEIFINIKLKF